MPVPTRSGPSPRRDKESKWTQKDLDYRKKMFVKRMRFKSAVKDRGSDKWLQQRWGLWWGAACKMTWSRRRLWTGWENWEWLKTKKGAYAAVCRDKMLFSSCSTLVSANWNMRGNINLLTCTSMQHKGSLYTSLADNYLSRAVRVPISAPAPAGIRHFFQIWQKSGSGKNPTGAG